MEGLGAAAQASFTEGGIDTTFQGSYGELFGANIFANLNSGAINFRELHAAEFNLTAASGSSVFSKVIVQIIGGGNDSVKGASGDDVMLLLGQQEIGGLSPAAYYDTGIQFSEASSAWPFGPSASLIGVAEPQNPSTAGARQASAGYGVNFGYVSFATAAWQTIGSTIDGSGNATFQGLTIGNWSLSLSSGSLVLNGTNKQTSAISVHSGGGGSGWAVGDKFTWGATGVGKVTTVSSGAATAVSQLVPDSEASPGTSAVATTATNNTVYHTGGTGLTIDTTVVGPGNFNLGGASALSTSATSGFLQIATTAGTPTGTVGAAGAAAVVIDTTNKKLCYSTGGGTWECSAA